MCTWNSSNKSCVHRSIFLSHTMEEYAKHPYLRKGYVANWAILIIRWVLHKILLKRLCSSNALDLLKGIIILDISALRQHQNLDKTWYAFLIFFFCFSKNLLWCIFVLFRFHWLRYHIFCDSRLDWPLMYKFHLSWVFYIQFSTSACGP